MDSKQKTYWLNKINKDSDERILKDILFSDEGVEVFADIYDIQKASNELREWKKIDSQKAWKRIDDSTKNFNIFSFKYVSVAAAVLILGISVLLMNRDTVYYSGDSEKHLVLNDGSDIILAPNSELIVSNNFNGNKREVKLAGDGFFNIYKNQTKPFVIETDKAKIKVLGTVFYVEQSTEGVKVDLISGKVEIKRRDGIVAALNQNETALIDSEIKITGLNKNKMPVIEDLFLDDISIRDAVVRFNQIYGDKVIELIEPGSKLWDKTIHTTVKNSSVREFINGLELIFDVKVINSKGKFIVSNLKMK